MSGESLLAYALALPEAWEDHPWGETVVKVGKKVFVFMGSPSPGAVSLSVKLPSSMLAALERPECAPTGYGLGRAGWVSARYGPDDELPEALLQAWIRESYRAVAPRRLARLVVDPG